MNFLPFKHLHLRSLKRPSFKLSHMLMNAAIEKSSGSLMEIACVRDGFQLWFQDIEYSVDITEYSR